jgi:4-diphosphocytidyl-2-C-methyl-D-erythritol kinase
MDVSRRAWLAASKVNLYLGITGRRADGYHELESLVVPVSLCDRVSCTDAAGVSCRVVGVGQMVGTVAEIPESSNLAWRAAQLLRETAGLTRGVDIVIEKQIPLGGGMGGGSADAAAVLVGLNDFWELGMSVEALAGLGATLGSDMPAMVHGGAVRMEGVGERVTPLEGTIGPYWLVLLNPGFPVATADIYYRYSQALTSGGGDYKSAVSAYIEGDVDRLADALFNGLQETVFCKYPLIGMMHKWLLEAGARGALLSGSGGTVFGLCRTREEAESVLEAVRAGPGASMWTGLVHTLPDSVMAAHESLTLIV